MDVELITHAFSIKFKSSIHQVQAYPMPFKALPTTARGRFAIAIVFTTMSVTGSETEGPWQLCSRHTLPSQPELPLPGQRLTCTFGLEFSFRRFVIPSPSGCIRKHLLSPPRTCLKRLNPWKLLLGVGHPFGDTPTLESMPFHYHKAVLCCLPHSWLLRLAPMAVLHSVARLAVPEPPARVPPMTSGVRMEQPLGEDTGRLACQLDKISKLRMMKGQEMF